MFTREPVSDATITQLIDAAAHAPSAHHGQPWRFIVVRPGVARTRLANAMARPFRRRLQADGLPPARIEEAVDRSRRRIERAPGLVILCLDQSAIPPAPGRKRSQLERVLATQSVALAGGTFLLACEATGLAAGWLSAPLFAAGAVRRALSVPDTWEPQAMILFGRRAGPPLPRRRRPVEDVTLWH